MYLFRVLLLGVLLAGVLMWIGNLIRSRANEAMERDPWSHGGIKTIAVFMLVLLVLTSFTISNDWRTLLAIALIGILIVLVWLYWDPIKNWRWFLFAIEVLLLGLGIWAADTDRLAEIVPSWLGSIASIAAYAIIPGIAVVMAALLLRRLLSNGQSLNWSIMIPNVLMITILFLMIGYQGMLMSIWDVATDGLRWMALWLMTSIFGIGTALLLAWSIPRKKFWAAVIFALITPLVLQQARNLGTYDRNHKWGTTPIITTEQRAAKIDHAIQQYYEKNNRYPQNLSNLIPRYILYIPNPFIIPGQDWCYEGGDEYYRFGYLYRQFFSLPVSVRIHSSAGEAPDGNWECQKKADQYPKPPGF